MTMTTTRDRAEARDLLGEASIDLGDAADAWERLERSTPGTLPHIAMTCRDVATTTRRAARHLGQLSREVHHERIDLATADAYLDAARIQLDQLHAARVLISRVIA